jgi:hypothetical protein
LEQLTSAQWSDAALERDFCQSRRVDDQSVPPFAERNLHFEDWLGRRDVIECHGCMLLVLEHGCVSDFPRSSQSRASW